MTTMCVGLACLCFKPDPNCLSWQKGPLPATWGVLCARCQTYLLEQLAQCIQSSVRSRAIVPAVWGLAVSMGADVFRSRSSEVLAAADAIRTARVLDDYARQLAGEQGISLPDCAYKKIDLAADPIDGRLDINLAVDPIDSVLDTVSQYATWLLDNLPGLYQSVWVGDMMYDLDSWGHAWRLQLDSVDEENRTLARR